MKEKLNLKLFFLLVITGIITSLMVLPFTFAFIDLPEDIPLSLIVVAQTIQVSIILSIASFCGMKLIKKTNIIGFSMLEDLINHQTIHFGFVKSSVLWGIIGGILTVLLCIPFWDLSVNLLIDEMNVALYKSVLACFYGGIGEEIIFRLGMTTCFIWLFQKLHFKKSCYWLAILVSGVIFGLGHIGITSHLTAITYDVVIRAVLLNGSLSIIYGILYLKKGLESAMIAHFTTDVILHILIPHCIALFFI